MFEFVKADFRMFTPKGTGTTTKLGIMLFNLGLHAVLFYRLSRWFHLHHMRPVAILIGYINSVITGAQISTRAKIGKGLCIFHPQGTVIGATAVIGDYCTLTGANAIGQLYGNDDRPIIGNHCYIGVGAKILGKIEVGNNVIIGPNAVVIDSLPDGVTVAVLPAKIVFRVGSYPPTKDYEAHSVSREAILRRLIPLLTSTVDMRAAIDSIDEATGLLGEGIGLDSMEVLRLVGAIEEEFQLTIYDGELKTSHFKTIGALATFVQERLSP